MTAYSLLPQEPNVSCPGPASLERRMEARRSSLDEPVFGIYPSNHQAPLCWSCFLPIFSNRPGMFDGDLATCLAEDDKEPVYQNNSDQSMNASNLPGCPSDVSVCDDVCTAQTAFQNKGKGQPLVTIPSPVSILPDDHTSRPEQQQYVIPAVENQNDDEAPELTFSDVTSGGDESPTGRAGLRYFNRFKGHRRRTRDIIDCNIVDRIKIQAVLKQGRMKIPFVTRVPFPRSRNARYNGLENRPFSTNLDVKVLGKLQVGTQKLSFAFTSEVQ